MDMRISSYIGIFLITSGLPPSAYAADIAQRYELNSSERVCIAENESCNSDIHGCCADLDCVGGSAGGKYCLRFKEHAKVLSRGLLFAECACNNSRPSGVYRGDTVALLFTYQLISQPPIGGVQSVSVGTCPVDPGCSMNNHFTGSVTIRVTNWSTSDSSIYKDSVFGVIQ
jgi:hypothetical protein